MSAIPTKSKEERLREGITILMKLRDLKIPAMNFGIQTIQKKISAWVSSGIPMTEIIPISNYDRDAHLTLRSEKGETSQIVLKQIPDALD